MSLHASILDRLNNAPAHAIIDRLPIEESQFSPAGGLSGVPFAVQNNICVSNARLTCGSEVLRNYVAPYDATVIDRLKEAGAVPVCTTNMDEFGVGLTGGCSFFGMPENPSVKGFCPGGSASGAAALVAAGCVPLALASDTGGDARLASAWCGAMALKPSQGAYSRYGLVAHSPSLEQIALIGSDLSILSLAHRCLSYRKDKKDATHWGLQSTSEKLEGRIAWIDGRQFDANKSICHALEDACHKMQRNGLETFKEEMPYIREISAAYYAIVSAEFSASMARIIPLFCESSGEPADWKTRYMAFRDKLGKEVKKRISAGAYILQKDHYESYYMRAISVRNWLRQWFDDLFRKCKLVLLPVCQTGAPSVLDQNSSNEHLDEFISLTACANLAGLPALSLPYGLDNQGRPLAIQCIAPYGKDEWLLDAARMLTGKEGDCF